MKQKMTTGEAIETLSSLQGLPLNDILNMALHAMKEVQELKQEMGWIRCKDQMPPEKEIEDVFYGCDNGTMTFGGIPVTRRESDTVNVTVKNLETGDVFSSSDHTENGEWKNFWYREQFEVTAWMPLPLPLTD